MRNTTAGSSYRPRRQCLVAMALATLQLSSNVIFPATASAATASQGKKVALLVTAANLPFPGGVKAAFLDRAKALGMEVTSFDQVFDAARQAQQVDDAIARRFDMLALMAVSEQAIMPALQRAKRANIPVIIVNSPPKDGAEKFYLSYIGEDATEMGRLSGRSMLEALKRRGIDGGRIALITGSLQEGVAPRRLAGIKEALAANPKVEIVAVEDAHWDPVASERIAGQLLARFAPQGGLDLIYGMNDDQAVAVVRAATAAGVPLGTAPGQLTVVGGNCTRQGMALITEGKEYSTGVQGPARTGTGAADLVNDYFAGKTLKQFDYLPIGTVTSATLDQWRSTCDY